MFWGIVQPPQCKLDWDIKQILVWAERNSFWSQKKPVSTIKLWPFSGCILMLSWMERKNKIASTFLSGQISTLYKIETFVLNNTTPFAIVRGKLH